MNAQAADIVRTVVEFARKAGGGQTLLREIRDGLSRELRGDGVGSVTLVTPSGDETHLAQAIAKMLEQRTGSPVEVAQRKDPSLIGGAILQYGDQQIDLSVRGSLNDIGMKIRAA